MGYAAKHRADVSLLNTKIDVYALKAVYIETTHRLFHNLCVRRTLTIILECLCIHFQPSRVIGYPLVLERADKEYFFEPV